MSLPVFQRFQFIPTSLEQVCRQLNQLIGSLGVFFDRLTRNPRLDSIVYPSVSLAGAADTTINHKLGRQPVGVDWSRPTAAATIHWVSWNATAVVLHASGAVNVDLEVW